MIDNIKEIKDFVTFGIDDVYTDFRFYKQQKISVPQFNRGILTGKKLAYEAVLEFINNLGNSQKESK